MSQLGSSRHCLDPSRHCLGQAERRPVQERCFELASVKRAISCGCGAQPSPWWRWCPRSRSPARARGRPGWRGGAQWMRSTTWGPRKMLSRVVSLSIVGSHCNVKPVKAATLVAIRTPCRLPGSRAPVRRGVARCFTCLAGGQTMAGRAMRPCCRPPIAVRFEQRGTRLATRRAQVARGLILHLATQIERGRPVDRVDVDRSVHDLA